MCLGPSKITTEHNYIASNDNTMVPLVLLKDETYLLRRCARYDWDSVERFCDTITKMLSSSTTDDVYILDGLKQLVATDDEGNTALHIACFHEPPLQIIHKLLQVAANAPTGPIQIHLMKNAMDEMPLSIASTYGAPKNTLACLMYASLLTNSMDTVQCN